MAQPQTNLSTGPVCMRKLQGKSRSAHPPRMLKQKQIRNTAPHAAATTLSSPSVGAEAVRQEPPGAPSAHAEAIASAKHCNALLRTDTCQAMSPARATSKYDRNPGTKSRKRNRNRQNQIQKKQSRIFTRLVNASVLSQLHWEPEQGIDQARRKKASPANSKQLATATRMHASKKEDGSGQALGMETPSTFAFALAFRLPLCATCGGVECRLEVANWACFLYTLALRLSVAERVPVHRACQ